jgi:hypothetical protein
MMTPTSTTKIATWLLGRSGGCPRGARLRLWFVMTVAALAASQAALLLTSPVPGAGLSFVLSIPLIAAASTLIFTRVLVPIEDSIAAEDDARR